MGRSGDYWDESLGLAREVRVFKLMLHKIMSRSIDSVRSKNFSSSIG